METRATQGAAKKIPQNHHDNDPREKCQPGAIISPTLLHHFETAAMNAQNQLCSELNKTRSLQLHEVHPNNMTKKLYARSRSSKVSSELENLHHREQLNAWERNTKADSHC